MKLNRILTALFCSSFVLSGCLDDGKEEFLDEYSTFMYFTNSGEQAVTCYKTGDLTAYNVYVYKAGNENSAASDAVVSVMDESQLQIYNGENGTKYTQLPSTCYALEGDLNMSFSGNELYKTLTVNMDADKINALSPAEYVVPLVLTSSKTVNEKKNVVFVKPNIVTPTIYFAQTGYVLTQLSASSPDQITVNIPITMPLSNKWNFDCKIAVNQSLLDEYNKKNETNYSLLPVGSYTLEDTYSFAAGTNTVNAVLTINRSALDMGDYILPIELAECSQNGFEIDQTKNVYLAGVSYMPPQLELTVSMLSANATVSDAYGDGAGLAGLIDGDLTGGGYYHSDYAEGKYDPVYGHYIDVHLNTPVTFIMFDYWTRVSNGNGAPKVIDLYTSNNGTEWTKLSTVSNGLPTEGNQEYISNIFKAQSPFTYFRFAVVQSAAGSLTTEGAGSSAYFNLHELSLYGQ